MHDLQKKSVKFFLAIHQGHNYWFGRFLARKKASCLLSSRGSNKGLTECGMGLRREAGCGMLNAEYWRRNIIILLGRGYAVFYGRNARCFDIDDGIED